MAIIMHDCKRIVGGYKLIDLWERNALMSVHIDKLPLALGPNSGDPISIGTYPLLTHTIREHSVGGEHVQQRQLACRALALEVLIAFPWFLSRVRMKNTGEAKRLRSM